MKIQNYIGGKFSPPANSTYFNNIDPSTNEVFSEIPDSDAEDVAKAVESAQKAYRNWGNAGIEFRSSVVLKIADGIERNLEELARAESKDNGKPLSLARTVDIPRAASNFRFFGSAIKHFSSESHYMEGKGLNYTLRRPLGVVGCISPWNLPLYLFSWKIAPALAAGNCVVAKPSEVTPYTAYLLGKILQEAELPKGVLNIVQGRGTSAGAAIVEHPGIKAISFTGGTSTGAVIGKIAAQHFKKVSLELGGKNPNVVCDDADLENAIETSVRSSFSNQGQICLCGSRILIHRDVYEKFREGFVKRVKQLIVGDPLEAKTNVGAIVSEDHFKKILSYIELAKQEGGSILCGGRAVQPEGRCKNGFFIEPTVIEGLKADCRLNQEEIFGPVVSLIPFNDIEHAIEMANGTSYGLAATVWTSDLQHAHYISEQLDCGIVWVNSWMVRDLRTPFGGTKQSGIGREGGWEALRFFTEPKNVFIPY